eukprot:TCONS_00027937-protein
MKIRHFQRLAVLAIMLQSFGNVVGNIGNDLIIGACKEKASLDCNKMVSQNPDLDYRMCWEKKFALCYSAWKQVIKGTNRDNVFCVMVKKQDIVICYFDENEHTVCVEVVYEVEECI